MFAWRYVSFPVPFDAPPLRPRGSQVHSRPRYSATYRPMRVQRPQRARAEPWTTGRVRAPDYRPLEMFGGAAEEEQQRPLEEQCSEDVELLELCLRLKEFELRRTIGESETSPDRFVRNISWYKETRGRSDARVLLK